MRTKHRHDLEQSYEYMKHPTDDGEVEIFYVDIPDIEKIICDKYDVTFKNIGKFYTYEEALAFVKENFGADGVHK